MKGLNKHAPSKTSVWSELRRSKTIGRALLNVELSRLLPMLTGTALDLGGGSGSYLRFIPDTLRLTRTDYKGKGLDALVDINEALPYPDASFDAVLLLNALYVGTDPRAVLAEILRILRPGGQLILSTPYLMAEMREPHDYFRFTSEWLERTLTELGYMHVKLVPLGERFMSAANLIDGFGTRIGRMLAYPFAALADTLLPSKIRKEHPAPIVYIATANAPV